MSKGKILIIAGTDSSGGAGLTRDTSVATLLGLDVLPVVTAVTAQTHSGVWAINPMSVSFIKWQIEAALASEPIQAIKIGMLCNAQIAKCVADCISHCSVPVVIDPVLKSSSGKSLTSGHLSNKLLALADLVTPNLSEAAAFSKRAPASDANEIAAQARAIMSSGCKAVLIKGGHGSGPASVDHLFDTSGHRQFSAPRLKTDKRGTGCFLATAIACKLASGENLANACHSAKGILYDWLQRAP